MENNNAKVIKLKINGEIIERLMTIEEVHKQFNNMIKNFANDCVVQSKTMHNNVDAFEDFVSEGYIVLVECFKSYSPTFTFSSYLSSALDLTRKELLRKMHSDKRKITTCLVSFDEPVDNELNLGDVEGKDDVSFDLLAHNDSINYALNYLTEEEKRIFGFLLDTEMTKINMAEELNITRPTLDTRIKKTRSKLVNLFSDSIGVA